MSLKAREGIIVQLQLNGITAYGEAAPLPDRSSESLSQVVHQLENNSSDINRLFQAEPVPGGLDDFFHKCNIVPSLRFALDTLAYNYSIQARKSSLTQFDDSPKRIAVNATIPISTETDTLLAARQARQDGYNTFKLKVGRDFSKELSLLKKLRAHFPDVTLRLDANRAWETDEAIRNLSLLQELNIEYCEEPINRPTYSTLKELSEYSPVSLALDETLTDLSVIREVVPFTPFLILKPMTIGKFSDLFATKRLADSHEHTVVLTTSLESGVGRLMTAVLALATGSQHVAHGLSTGTLLEVDIWRDGSYIQKGYFSLPDGTFSGQGNQSNLKQIAEEIFITGE